MLPLPDQENRLVPQLSILPPLAMATLAKPRPAPAATLSTRMAYAVPSQPPEMRRNVMSRLVPVTQVPTGLCIRLPRSHFISPRVVEPAPNAGVATAPGPHPAIPSSWMSRPLTPAVNDSADPAACAMPIFLSFHQSRAFMLIALVAWCEHVSHETPVCEDMA